MLSRIVLRGARPISGRALIYRSHKLIPISQPYFVRNFSGDPRRQEALRILKQTALIGGGIFIVYQLSGVLFYVAIAGVGFIALRKLFRVLAPQTGLSGPGGPSGKGGRNSIESFLLNLNKKAQVNPAYRIVQAPVKFIFARVIRSYMQNAYMSIKKVQQVVTSEVLSHYPLSVELGSPLESTEEDTLQIDARDDSNGDLLIEHFFQVRGSRGRGIIHSKMVLLGNEELMAEAFSEEVAENDPVWRQTKGPAFAKLVKIKKLTLEKERGGTIDLLPNFRLFSDYTEPTKRSRPSGSSGSRTRAQPTVIDVEYEEVSKK